MALSFFFILYLLINVMLLTRQQKDQRILDLFEQGHNTREITHEVHASFSYIGAVLRKAAKEKEIEEQQVQKASLSTQAYKLFLGGKNPVQVAITLNIRQPEVDQYFKEFCKLEKLNGLYQMYEEITADVGSLVNLYKLMKDADLKPEQTVKLLSFANNNLADLHLKCNALRTELEHLNGRKESLNNALQNITKNLEYYTLRCQQELSKMDQLHQQRERQENIVRNFENSNKEYFKIKKFVEDRVTWYLISWKTICKVCSFVCNRINKKGSRKICAVNWS